MSQGNGNGTAEASSIVSWAQGGFADVAAAARDRRGEVVRRRVRPDAGAAVAAQRPARGAARRVVDDVSFEIRRGEIFGVIGANGSGKSTLIRIISTLLLPDGGDVRVFGLDAVKRVDARCGR